MSSEAGSGNATIRTLEEQNAQLLALFLASQRLSSTLQTEDVKRTVLDILTEFTGAAEASVWVQDPIRGKLQLTAGHGVDRFLGRTISEGSGLIGAVAATGEEILDGEGKTDPATDLPVLAAVPLRMAESTIGAVAVHRLLPQKQGLDETDRELLRLIAGQAAAAITSARLYEESRAALAGVRELGQHVVSHLDDLEAVATTTVNTLLRMMRADVCQLYLLDEESGDLVLTAAAGVPDPSIGSTLRPGQGIAGRAIGEGRLLRVDRRGIQSSWRLAALEDSAAGTPLGSIMASPLRAGKHAIGVLSVGRGIGSAEWREEDELILSTAADQLAVGINNARLYARVEDDYYKMSTLFMAANRLHATLDLEEILVSARDILESLVGARNYALLLVDEVTKELRIVMAEGISPLHRSTFHASLEEGFLAKVLLSGEAHVVPAGQAPTERLFGQPVLACVPLRVENAVVGAFVINRLSPQKKSLVTYDAELFSMLAQHAATAILAARLYARSEQRLVSLYDLSRLISASVSSEEILDLTMALVTQVMRARVSALYSLNPDSGTLTMTRSSGLAGKSPSRHWSLGEGAVKEVASSGEIVETEDAATDPRFQGMETFFHGPTIVLPLKVGKNVIGVLVITDKLGDEGFGKDDRRLASTLAGQIAMILHQVSLYQQAQHLAILLEREREALRDANRDLEVANRQLDALVEHMSEGVLLLDADGRTLRLNAAGRAMMAPGGEIDLPEELAEWQRFDIQNPEGKPLRIEEWPVGRALRGESVRSAEVWISNLSGGRIRLQVGAEPVRGPGDRIVMAVMVFRDVTEERALDRAKDEFLAIASHELKNPLTSLKGYAQLLLRQSAKIGTHSVDTRTLQAINEQSDRLVRLIDQLLDVSRIDLGRIQLDVEPTDMVEIVDRLVSDQRVAVPELSFKLNIAQNRIVGQLDRARVEQVITNLLSNACKFAPPGSEVEIGLEATGSAVILSIHDEGQGVPPEQIERIFDRYAQVGSKQKQGKGLGLGLYISRQIVAAHGGRIWAESEPGNGATFYVELPLVAKIDSNSGRTGEDR